MASRVSHFGQSAAYTKLMWQKTLCMRLQLERLSVCKLEQVLLGLPAGSAATERAFSLINLLKSDLRDRLEEAHLIVCCKRLKRSQYSSKDFPYAAAAADYHKTPRRMASLIA